MTTAAARLPEPTRTPALGDADREQIELMGLAIDRLTQDQVVEHIVGALAEGRGGWVVTPNLDHLRRYQRDEAVRPMYRDADLVLADGMPLVWASRVAGRALPERVAGSALVSDLAQALADQGRTLFLLGGEPGAAEGAAEVLRDLHGVTIAGLYSPPMGFEDDKAQWQAMREALWDAKPDVVYVALGSPKQENVILRLRETLPASWWLGVGVSLSFLSGQVTRAPGWMQKCGLEWVHRVVQEPRRLARRYLIEGIPFGLRLMSWAVVTRLRGGKN